MSSVIRSENFDSVTAPALPTGFSGSSGVVTSVTAPRSGANSLVIPNTSGGTKVVSLSTNDGAQGNSKFRVWFRFEGTEAAQEVLVYTRGDSSGNGYHALVEVGSTDTVLGLSLFKRISGSLTKLIGPIGAAFFSHDAYFGVQIIANGSSISANVQRDFDGKWLQADGTAGTFAEQAALIVGDTSITGVGISGVLAATDGNLYLDDWLFESLTIPLSIGGIGDSILFGLNLNAGEDPLTIMANVLSKENSLILVTTTNQGHNGASTADWLVGAGSGYMATADTAFDAANVTEVHMMLGANDSAAHTTAAVYRTNMAAICAHNLSRGRKTRLHYPSYIPAGANSGATDLTAVGLAEQYTREIDGLIDNVNILRGDVLSRKYLAVNQGEMQVDLTHPAAAGARSLGNLWAASMSGYANGAESVFGFLGWTPSSPKRWS